MELDWNAVGAVGEMLGGSAVVVSLIYLSFQVRQNTRALREAVAGAPADGVLTIRLTGDVSRFDPRRLSAARLRRHAPDTMNIEIRTDAPFVRRRGTRPGRNGSGASERSADGGALQLDL